MACCPEIDAAIDSVYTRKWILKGCMLAPLRSLYAATGPLAIRLKRNNAITKGMINGFFSVFA